MAKAIGVLYNAMRVDRSSALKLAATLGVQAAAVVAVQNKEDALSIEVLYAPEKPAAEQSLFERIMGS